MFVIFLMCKRAFKYLTLINQKYFLADILQLTREVMYNGTPVIFT